MQSAYGNFVEHVEMASNSGDKQTVFRILNLTRIELATLESFLRYGQGEKCPEKCLLAKIFILS